MLTLAKIFPPALFLLIYMPSLVIAQPIDDLVDAQTEALNELLRKEDSETYNKRLKILTTFAAGKKKDCSWALKLLVNHLDAQVQFPKLRDKINLNTDSSVNLFQTCSSNSKFSVGVLSYLQELMRLPFESNKVNAVDSFINKTYLPALKKDSKAFLPAITDFILSYQLNFLLLDNFKTFYTELKKVNPAIAESDKFKNVASDFANFDTNLIAEPKSEEVFFWNELSRSRYSMKKHDLNGSKKILDKLKNHTSTEEENFWLHVNFSLLYIYMEQPQNLSKSVEKFMEIEISAKGLNPIQQVRGLNMALSDKGADAVSTLKTLKFEPFSLNSTHTKVEICFIEKLLLNMATCSEGLSSTFKDVPAQILSKGLVQSYLNLESILGGTTSKENLEVQLSEALSKFEKKYDKSYYTHRLRLILNKFVKK